MRLLWLTMAVVSGLGAASASASASASPKHWTPVRERKAQLEAVLARGEKSGKLLGWQSRRARGLFSDISRRELRYEASAPGLTLTEKGNLDFRFYGIIDELNRIIASK